MGFQPCYATLIKSFLLGVLISRGIVLTVSEGVIEDDEEQFHINRYFLQIDNIFDFKGAEVLTQSRRNDCFYKSVEQDWIAQPLDHFNPLEENSFWQRYLHVSSKECVDGSSRCPICLFIGGDAAIHPWWLEQTFLAQKCITELKGRAFLLEHRFYGYSAPMNGTTLEKLQYLTVPQALEDVASFIFFIRRVYNMERNKLFVFGASYGGTLSALFRRKFPHLTVAAVALSAPMIREYVDKDYLSSIGKKIRNTDIRCYKQIELGLRQAARLMENHVCSRQEYPLCHKIRVNFGLCSSLKGMTKVERRVFFSTFVKDFAFLAEYDGVLNVTLKNICNVISHPDIESWSPMDKLLAGDSVISRHLFKSSTRAGIDDENHCIQAKRQVLCNYLRNDTDEHEGVRQGRRQRLWQKCTELGSFRISGDSKLQPFGGGDVLPASFQQDFCVCAFGERFSQSFTLYRLRNYYKQFGSFSPTLPAAGSKIIYTIGDEDPVLHRELKLIERLGPKTLTHNENVIFKVKGSAHCGEVFQKSQGSSLKTTRMKVKRLLVSLVQEEVVHQLMEWLQ